MSIPEEPLGQLRQRAAIDEIAARHTHLTPSSRGESKGCCPIPDHDERTPSFCVNPAARVFHCFGFGRGGDVITFLELGEQFTFREALEQVAERVGITPVEHLDCIRDFAAQLVEDPALWTPLSLPDSLEPEVLLPERYCTVVGRASAVPADQPNRWAWLLSTAPNEAASAANTALRVGTSAQREPRQVAIECARAYGPMRLARCVRPRQTQYPGGTS